jgi:uncharacterized protein (TIGR04255 family)
MPDQEKQPYGRPPITEAVIEIKFAAALPADLLNAVNKAFSDSYPGEQILKMVEVRLDMDGGLLQPKTNVGPEIVTYRRAASDQQELFVITPESLTISQLAPYPGWMVFFDRFRRDWTLWKRVASYHKIARLGVRYINRLDLKGEGETIEYAPFINVAPSLPEQLGPTLSYAVNAIFPLARIGCKLIINSAVVVPPPVPGFTSFLLDLDISREGDVPQRDDEIFALLSEIRLEKNNVFEACITDRARELFEWRQ